MKLKAQAQVNNKKQNKKESNMTTEQDILNLVASFYGDAIKAQANNKTQNKKESNMTKVKAQVKAQNNLSLADAIMQILHNSKTCLKASEISKLVKASFADAGFKTDSKYVSSRLLGLVKSNKVNVKRDADGVNVYFISKAKNVDTSKAKNADTSKAKNVDSKIYDAYIKKFDTTITLSKQFIDRLLVTVFDNNSYKSTKQGIYEAKSNGILLKDNVNGIPLKTIINHLLSKMTVYNIDYIDKKTEVRYSKFTDEPYLVNLYRLTK